MFLGDSRKLDNSAPFLHLFPSSKHFCSNGQSKDPLQETNSPSSPHKDVQVLRALQKHSDNPVTSPCFGRCHLEGPMNPNGSDYSTWRWWILKKIWSGDGEGRFFLGILLWATRNLEGSPLGKSSFSEAKWHTQLLEAGGERKARIL